MAKWNDSTCTQFVSLDDVMSEQLAIQLDQQENHCGHKECQDESLVVELSGDCGNDEMLARLLQHEFDVQHDLVLKREEKQRNANSKVSVSWDRFRRVPHEHLLDDDKQHEYGEESKHWDSFEKQQKQQICIGTKGFAKRNGVMTTKHDLEMSARKNACKVMEWESGLNTGDGGNFDMKLNNNVFNALKVHAISEGKRSARIHEKKEKSTAEKVLDEKSRIILFKLINRGILDVINGIVATGKESVVIHGRGANIDNGVTQSEVAIKIFKTTLNEFKNRDKYIVADPLLSRANTNNARKLIPLWAEKEMHALNRIGSNGILCPRVVFLKKHILIMTFIGADGKPAPNLKDAKLNESQLENAFKQTFQIMIKLYRDCNLIHADLSEFNLLWHEHKVYCIDVSQSINTTHPMANKFLWRDCVNIHRFFAKFCLENLMSAREMFETICGKKLNCDENDENAVDLLDKIDHYQREEDLLKQTQESDPFDEMFEKSLKEKQTHVI